ncbi:unnamed protein product [Symbiodinium microadriaticum]|nr:unnamed protein product [Symbiodinium microadriaticum]
MGIPHGVTLICGGGFHGKSTLLKAIERGVYNHIPGDGRELVITNPSAVKIRAEDGRNVGCVDISTFIDNLPHGKQTNAFSSSDASGSTSQAANIQEALEAGSTCLLLDEDTCATNFMIRDARMQLLVAGDKEPIKPFIYRVRALAGCGISSILVVGGCGEYFDVADLVVSMDEFRPIDTTARAKEISAQFITAEQARILGENERFVIPGRALASPRVVANALHRNVGKIMVRNKSLVQFGDLELDLSCVEQIVDSSQTRAIADALRYIQGHLLECGANRGDGVNMVKAMSVAEILDSIEAAFASGGMDVLSIEGRVAGNYALPRRYEIAAALNRIRSATFSQQK